MIFDVQEVSFAEEAESKFVIDNDTKADWAIAKIFEEREEINRLQKLATERIQSITDKFNEEKAKADSTITFFEVALEKYFDMVEHKSSKTGTESYKLLSGKLVRKAPERKYIRDEEKLMQYVKSNAPQFIRTTECVDWVNLKKNITAVGDAVIDNTTGAVIDGITLGEETRKFEVK